MRLSLADGPFATTCMVSLLGRPVATTTRATGWMNYFNDPSNQRSEKMPLEKGQDYLLVSEFAETYHLDYINVSTLSNAVLSRERGRERLCERFLSPSSPPPDPTLHLV